jgi:carboxyl-terminal processing protease
VRTRFYLAGAIILLLTFSVGIYSQTGAARRATNNASDAASGARPGANTRVTGAVVKSDVSEALSVIQDNYIDGKKLDYNTVFKSSISGMLTVLDPHSTYLDAADYTAFKTEQRSQYFGIGATIGDLTQGDQTNTYIRATFEDAPAARAGLRFGDKIVAVDGQSM